jgi:hypothetical protein
MNKEAHVKTKKEYRILLENCIEIKSLRRRNLAVQMFHAYLVTQSEKLQRKGMMNSELDGLWHEAVLYSFQVSTHDSVKELKVAYWACLRYCSC